MEKPEQGGRQGSHQGEGKAPASAPSPAPGRTELMRVVGKPGHKAPEIPRMERTGGPSPEMRLGSVQDAGTLDLHCHVLRPWGGVPGEGDGKAGGGGQYWF